MRARVLLDPTGEMSPGSRPAAARPESLVGVEVALVDIAKPRGNVFLDRLETLMRDRGIVTRRYRKPTHAKPAPADLRLQITQECGAVIQALAD